VSATARDVKKTRQLQD